MLALSLEFIRKHKSDGHNYIHIGLVQVVVKSLTRKGLNASVLLCLRDARFTNFSDSILRIIESGLYNGPIHLTTNNQLYEEELGMARYKHLESAPQA